MNHSHHQNHIQEDLSTTDVSSTTHQKEVTMKQPETSSNTKVNDDSVMTDFQENLEIEMAQESDTKRDQTILKPRTNLYTSPEGWFLIASLPHADQKLANLETEGDVLTLSVPHQEQGIYQQTIRFPRGTHWGELKASWEGELLHVHLLKATPEKRSVMIS